MCVPEDGSSSRALEMSFGRLLRRASSKASDLLTFNAGSAGSRPVQDGEIIFSKNNVCVHPAEPVPGQPEHHPGTTFHSALWSALCSFISSNPFGCVFVCSVYRWWCIVLKRWVWGDDTNFISLCHPKNFAPISSRQLISKKYLQVNETQESTLACVWLSVNPELWIAWICRELMFSLFPKINDRRNVQLSLFR